MDFDMETDRVCDEVIRRRARTVALQLPAGLRRRFDPIAREVRERTGAEAVFAADPCYGACDIPLNLRDLGVDLIVHYGHSGMDFSAGCEGGPQRWERGGTGEDAAGDGGQGGFSHRRSDGAGGADLPPILYVDCNVDVGALITDAGVDDDRGLADLWTKSLEENVLPGKGKDVGPLGLLTTVQYRPLLPLLRDTLMGIGVETVTGAAGPRCSFDGQVLGCSFECADAVASEVRAFLFLGEGDFHPLGVHLSTRKHVYTLNPYNGSVGQFDESDRKARLFLKQRLSAVGRALDASDFGVIVTTKPGQRRMELARGLLADIRDAGGTGHIIILTEVSPASLEHMRVDAFVNTACPRITYDDFSRHAKPLLTPYELGAVLSGPDLGDFFGEYRFDGFQGRQERVLGMNGSGRGKG